MTVLSHTGLQTLRLWRLQLEPYQARLAANADSSSVNWRQTSRNRLTTSHNWVSNDQSQGLQVPLMVDRTRLARVYDRRFEFIPQLGINHMHGAVHISREGNWSFICSLDSSHNWVSIFAVRPELGFLL